MSHKAKYRCCFGFTLIELMIVVAIMGVMVSYSIPAYHQYTIKAQLKQSYEFAAQLQTGIEAFYKRELRFPKNNEEAGLPPANLLIGNLISSIYVEDGVLNVTLGSKVNQKVAGQILSLQPMTVDGSPTSPISWACGYAMPPKGMRKAGQNQTNINRYYLPIECRL